MKHLKTFEQTSTPQIGDYIVTNYSLEHYDSDIINIKKYMNNTLGKVIDIDPNQKIPTYVIQYDNPPKSYEKNFNFQKNNEEDKQYHNYRFVNFNAIQYFDNKPFDINMVKDTQKYNL